MLCCYIFTFRDSQQILRWFFLAVVFASVSLNASCLENRFIIKTCRESVINRCGIILTLKLVLGTSILVNQTRTIKWAASTVWLTMHAPNCHMYNMIFPNKNKTESCSAYLSPDMQEEFEKIHIHDIKIIRVINPR